MMGEEHNLKLCTMLAVMVENAHDRQLNGKKSKFVAYKI